MTRTRKAIIASVFAYLQFASAIVLGLIVTPIVLRQVDARAYGLWLAANELVAYLALADLGVFAVLPWTIAEAEGRRNRDEIRRFISNGVVIGTVVSCLTAAATYAVWRWVPTALGLTAADRIALGGPLALLVAATCLCAPLTVFSAVLPGVQDVTFVGALSVSRAVASALLTVVLLLSGHGLYALSLGAAIPMIAVAIAGTARVARLDPALLRRWPRPSVGGVRQLFGMGVGGWLGGFGWRLVSMSSGLVLAATRRADWIAMYACTARLSQLLLQLCWIVPDSALVGLAQVHGEGRDDRRREIVDALMRLYLVFAGGAAVVVLAVNPAFVQWWVGPRFYGGLTLNVLLAAGLVVGSVAHGLAVLSSVLGRRTTMGAAGLAQGVVHVALAVALTLRLELNGLATATVLSASLLGPIGVRTLSSAAHLDARRILAPVLTWALRAIPVTLVAALVGASGLSLAAAGAAAIALGLAYLWVTRGVYADLPLHPVYRRLLSSVRLAPAAPNG